MKNKVKTSAILDMAQGQGDTPKGSFYQNSTWKK